MEPNGTKPPPESPRRPATMREMMEEMMRRMGMAEGELGPLACCQAMLGAAPEKPGEVTGCPCSCRRRPG